MTDAWQRPEIKTLNLSIRVQRKLPDHTVEVPAEWLIVEHGGRTMRLRVQKCHGGNAYLEIEAPMDFRFTRETAKDHRPKARKGVKK